MVRVLPHQIRREYRDETERHRMEVLAASVLHDDLEHYNKELRQIDYSLQVVWMPENVTHLPGITPGRFHVIRDTGENKPPGILVHETEDGKFKPLDSSIFELVRDSDLWNDQLQQAKAKKRTAAEASYRRQCEREREERIAHLNDVYKHMNSTSVLIP